MDSFDFLRDMLGQYLPRTIGDLRLDARAKLVALVLLVWAITSVTSYLGSSVLVVSVLGLIVASDLPLGYVLRGIRPLVPALAVFFVFQLLFAGNYDPTGSPIPWQWQAPGSDPDLHDHRLEPSPVDRVDRAAVLAVDGDQRPHLHDHDDRPDPRPRGAPDPDPVPARPGPRLRDDAGHRAAVRADPGRGAGADHEGAGGRAARTSAAAEGSASSSRRASSSRSSSRCSSAPFGGPKISSWPWRRAAPVGAGTHPPGPAPHAAFGLARSRRRRRLHRLHAALSVPL